MAKLFDEFVDATKVRCTACGIAIPKSVVEGARQRVPQSLRRAVGPGKSGPVGLCGCGVCGHAMIIRDGTARDLTRDEAASVNVKRWMTIVDHFIGKKLVG